jgi:hypothetical protein
VIAGRSDLFLLFTSDSLSTITTEKKRQRKEKRKKSVYICVYFNFHSTNKKSKGAASTAETSLNKEFNRML